MAEVGTAVIPVSGDFSPLFAQAQAASGPLGQRFNTLGRAAGMGLAAIAVGAGIAGKALYDIGEQFDNSYDQIRANTGATGRELDGLKDDFKNVVSSVPTEFGDAATAIADVNRRLGLTGQPLRILSKQFLELSRVTGTDLRTNIEQVTRAFGDWGIKVADQPAALNKLFRASQASGVAVDRISGLMVRFGSPLRQLGLDFDYTTALISKFEREGVNTNLVMGSMRMALRKFSEEGRDPAKALQTTINAIRNAGTTAEANTMAFEIFGARAGADMAAAVREGRFSVEDLYKSITGGKDTVLGAARATYDFAEQWQLFKQRVLVTLEPIATRVFGAVGTAMGFITKHSNIVIPLLAAVAAAIVAATIATLAWNAALWLNPIGLVVGAIAALVVVLIAAYTKSETFRNIIDTIGSALGMIANGIWTVVKAIWSVLWPAIKVVFTIWRTYFTVIFTFWKSLAKAVITVGKVIFDILVTVVGGAFNAVKAVVGSVIGFIIGYFRLWWSVVSTVVKIVVTLLRAVLTPVFNWVWSRISPVFSRLISGWKRVGGVFISIGKTIVNAVKSAFNFVKSIISSIVGFISGIVGRASNVAVRFGKAIFNGIRSAISGIGNVVSSVINGAIDGVKGAINSVVSFINGMIRKFNALPGPNITPIGALAKGTHYWRGGMTLVGEQGPELVNLPRGSKVTPADRTANILSSAPSMGPTGDIPAPEVRVFIGDQELTDIVRVEMKQQDRRSRLSYRTGVKA